jgi:hypothetical protein
MEQQNNKKKAMLDALEHSYGIVTTAAKIAGVGRTTHYRWLNEDDEYKQAVDDIDNAALDFAESALHGKIAKGDTTAIIFFLKTKGKKRGYSERYQPDDANGEKLTMPEFVQPPIEWVTPPKDESADA